MKILQLTQNTQEWHQHRATARNASDASAMMACSPYKTRAQLLQERATGIKPDVDAATQARFDRGHEIEAQARAIAEAMLGQELFPVIGMSDDGYLSASLDGITMDESTIVEIKSWNESKAADVRDGRVPDADRWQVVQQLVVSGADACMFIVTDGTRDKWAWLTVHLAPEDEAALRAGWEQYDKDVAAWTPEPVAQAPIGHAPETLPALRLEVTGAVTASNLTEFREHALAVIGAINRNLVTDADFADAEKTVKWCADAEARLKAAKDAALAQTESIEHAFRVIDDVAAELRRTRLDLDKLVKAEKDARKLAITKYAELDLANHIADLNLKLGAKQAGSIRAPMSGCFGHCVKGLKSLDNMTEKVTAELIQQKAAATEMALRMHTNRDSLRADGHDWGFLFPDFATVGTKSAEDFAALAHMRISQHKQAEADRMEKERQRIEAERERIRQEEERKAQAAAEAKAEAERARIRAEEQQKAQAEAVAAGIAPVVAAGSASDDTPELTLGAINERLSPISLSAAGTFSASSERQSYRDSDGMPTERAVLEREWRRMKIALSAPAAHPPAGFVLVPIELAKRVQETMGEFLMDHGWRQQDMDTSDEFGALLAVATKVKGLIYLTPSRDF